MGCSERFTRDAAAPKPLRAACTARGPHGRGRQPQAVRLPRTRPAVHVALARGHGRVGLRRESPPVHREERAGVQ
jgi:hypothetical protein